MKKEFLLITSISAAIVLLVPIPFRNALNNWGSYDSGPTEWSDYAEVAGLLGVAVSLLWLLLGLILIFNQSSRKFGQAFLITAAIMLFLSFTFFSAGDGLLKIMFKNFKPPSA
jgi:hypothetical protein